MAYLQLELSVANNSANATVSANLYICNTAGGWNHWSPPGSITIDGTTYSFNHSFSQHQSKQWIGSAQKTVAYGSGVSRAVSVSASYSTNVSFGTLTTSASATIKRPYQAAVVTEVRVNGKIADENTVCVLGQDTIKVTIRKTGSALQYAHYVAIGTSPLTYGNYSAAPGLESWEFKPSLDYFGKNHMRTLQQAWFAIGVRSYSTDGEYVVPATRLIKIKIPDNVKPTLTKHEIGIYSGGLGGKILQSKTRAEGRWSFGDDNLYGATIDRIVFKVDGYAFDLGRGKWPNHFPPGRLEDRQTFLPSSAGTKNWSMQVYDSRGRSSSYRGTYVVVPYENPVLTSLSADRCTSSGVLDASGTYAKVSYQLAISPADGSNSGALTIKLVDGSTSTTKAEISVPASSPSVNSSSIISGLSPEKAYLIVAELKDATGTVAKLTTTVQKAGVIFDLCPTGIGMGVTAIPGYVAFDEVVRPTIGLHDYGSNGNGEWIRFGNGVQICWQVTQEDTSIASPYGSLFVGSTSWTFPRPFSKPPAVSIGEAYWGTGASWGSAYNTTKTNCGIRLLDAVKRSDGATELSMIAIGRWR